MLDHPILGVTLFWLFISFSQINIAEDLLRERRIAEDVVDSLFVGEAIWLKTGKDEFLALYTDTAANNPHGAAILLHGLGGHPDWADVISPLRHGLAEHGWISLSLQMPLREVGAEVDDYIALIPESRDRIQAGIDFLKNKKIQNIVLIGHSLGALMGLNFVAKADNSDFKKVVLLGLPVLKTDQKYAQSLNLLQKIQVPVLDVFGSLDLPSVRDSAKKRKLAMKQNSFYRQTVIEGAGHRYRDFEPVLIKHIYSWLMRVTPN